MSLTSPSVLAPPAPAALPGAPRHASNDALRGSLKVRVLEAVRSNRRWTVIQLGHPWESVVGLLSQDIGDDLSEGQGATLQVHGVLTLEPLIDPLLNARMVGVAPGGGLVFQDGTAGDGARRWTVFPMYASGLVVE